MLLRYIDKLLRNSRMPEKHRNRGAFVSYYREYIRTHPKEVKSLLRKLIVRYKRKCPCIMRNKKLRKELLKLAVIRSIFNKYKVLSLYAVKPIPIPWPIPIRPPITPTGKRGFAPAPEIRKKPLTLYAIKPPTVLPLPLPKPPVSPSGKRGVPPASFENAKNIKRPPKEVIFKGVRGF